MSEAPHVQTAQSCAEHVNQLGGENSAQKKLYQNLFAGNERHFLKFSDDVNNRLKASNNQTVEYAATKKCGKCLFFLWDSAYEQEFHRLFDQPVKDDCGYKN